MNPLDLLGVNPAVTAVVFVAFAILFIILYKFLFKKVGQVLDERENLIKNKFTEIEDKQKKADELGRQYEQQLKEIEQKALLKLQEAVKEGALKREQILDQARKDAQQELARAKQVLQTDCFFVMIFQIL